MAREPIRTLTVQARTARFEVQARRVGGMNGEINVVALVRGEEQYIFMFDEANRTETLRMLGRYAADPDLSFTWYDAAVMSQKVREMLPAKSTQNSPIATSKSPRGTQTNVDSSHSRNTPAPRFRLS